MTPAEGAPKPSALELLGITADLQTRELYALVLLFLAADWTRANNHTNPSSLSEVTGSSLGHPDSDSHTSASTSPSSTTTFPTVWIYSLDSNTWTPILEPIRGRPPTSLSSDDSDAENLGLNATEPRPRLGHRMAYDPTRKAFLLFGGNRGGKTRLNDFWELQLNR